MMEDVLDDVITFLEKCLFAPKKGQKGAKVDGAVRENQLFCILLKIGYFNFLYFA